MEEHQFRKLLEIFPIVRSSAYCAEDDLSGTTNDDNNATSGHAGNSTSNLAGKDGMEVEKGNSTDECETLQKKPQVSLLSVSPVQGFWDPLKAVIQARLGDEEGQRFFDTFKRVHETLVMKTLSLDDIERIVTHVKLRQEHF